MITVVTPTTGNPQLADAIQGLKIQQTPFKHLLVVDGVHRLEAVYEILHTENWNTSDNVQLLVLPEATGFDRFNGHRIYGATSFLVNTPWIAWLDEDNRFEPDHLSTMLQLATENQLTWCHSLRKIIGQIGEYICHDDCECLGAHKNVLNDHLIDTNCFLISTALAWQLSPLWYRKAREPNVLPADRAITKTLLSANTQRGGCTGKYTVKYRVCARPDSVKEQFFIDGNSKTDSLRPWAKPQLYTF